MALRGRPGDNAEGGFLGGTRSPRPHCEAVREPRHNIIIGGKGTPGGLMWRCPGKSEVSLAGVQSPPLHGGLAQHGWPCGERPEMMLREVFSEGRGLRARTVRPDEWQGIALPPVPFREAGGQEGAMLGSA
jgi:hypothetical protein